MTEKLLVSLEDGVLRLLFHRPEKKNALDRETYRAAIDALEAARRDDSVRAVVFSGAGADFTAGNDIADFRDFFDSPQEYPALAFVKTLAVFEKPMVAAVRGDAVGVGTTMLFHCDLVYASADARLRMPFIDLGLVPEAGASLLVPRRVGMARAAQLLMLGEGFCGEEAMRLGVVNAIVPPDAVEAAAIDAARRLARKPVKALLATRRLMRGDPAETLERIDAEAALFVEALASPEARERFAAFLTRGK